MIKLNNSSLRESLLRAIKVIAFVILWVLLFYLIYSVITILVSAMLATLLLCGLIHRERRHFFFYWIRDRFRRRNHF